jgi:hypothetical protein
MIVIEVINFILVICVGYNNYPSNFVKFKYFKFEI